MIASYLVFKERIVSRTQGSISGTRCGQCFVKTFFRFLLGGSFNPLSHRRTLQSGTSTKTERKRNMHYSRALCNGCFTHKRSFFEVFWQNVGNAGCDHKAWIGPLRGTPHEIWGIGATIWWIWIWQRGWKPLRHPGRLYFCWLGPLTLFRKSAFRL